MSSVGAASAGAASNQYQILGHLATGGMAELYLARSVGIAGFERYVVLKRIMAEHSRNHRFVTMFLDEARLAAQLHHPNIAQVHDIGRVSDSYFFTLEYVHGENCRDLLQRVAALKRQIPVEHTLAVIAGAAAGLHYAHEKRGIDRQPLGIVHRDVSPSNLMVSYEGAVKLVDFGIAKAAHRMTETRSGAVKGKVAYMSPEQCTGATLDRRSDIFSLGIVLYEMSTMTRLFKHPTDFETMTHIVNKDVPAPTSRRADLPRELETIILRCLAKKPDERFQTAEELLEAIEDLAARERLSLSSTSLGRYIRELFGERPEPWYELEAAGEHTGLVTIETTSAGPEDLPPEAFGASSTRGQWTAGLGHGREWLPGSGAAVVSAVSVLEPSGPALAAESVPEEMEDDVDGDQNAAEAPTVMDPARPIPNPPVLPATRAERPTGGIAPVRLPLPPPELETPDPDPDDLANAPTIVGPVTGPLVLQDMPVVRDTPDREPSWSNERDPSWSAGSASGVSAIDLRPRRPWVLWSAIAAVVIGVVVIVLAASGGDDEGTPAPSAGPTADEAEVQPSADPDPDPDLDPQPPPTQPTAVVDVPPPVIDAATTAIPDSPPPVRDEPPPVTRQPPPPTRSSPPVTRQQVPTTRTTPPSTTRTRPKPPRTTTTAPPDKPRKPPAKCGGLYPPCD